MTTAITYQAGIMKFECGSADLQGSSWKEEMLTIDETLIPYRARFGGAYVDITAEFTQEIQDTEIDVNPGQTTVGAKAVRGDNERLYDPYIELPEIDGRGDFGGTKLKPEYPDWFGPGEECYVTLELEYNPDATPDDMKGGPYR